MSSMAEHKMCWVQRISLVRHNLHAAARTGDFSFFKTLQAHWFIDGTDYVGTLTAHLDDADTVLHTIDDLNAGMAYVHQDAFKVMYDSLRQNMNEHKETRRAKLCVDSSQQRQKAEYAVDKMANSAIDLIQNQPADSREQVAAVWIIGTTIIADAMKSCIDQIENIELSMDDFVRLEYAWHTVQTSVESAVSAIRGIFNLMAVSDPSASNENHGRRMSTSSAMSSASSASQVLRRLSSAFFTPATPVHQPQSRRSSNASMVSPQQIRSVVSAAIPNQLPDDVPPMSFSDMVSPRKSKFDGKLSPVPATPFVSDDVNPFDANFRNGAHFSQEIVGIDPIRMTDMSSPIPVPPMVADTIRSPNSLIAV